MISSLTDSNYLARALANGPRHPVEIPTYRWAVVRSFLAVGSTTAREVCRRLNLDPDEILYPPESDEESPEEERAHTMTGDRLSHLPAVPGYWWLIKSPFQPGEKFKAGLTPHGCSGWNGRPDFAGEGDDLAGAIAAALAKFFDANSELGTDLPPSLRID